MIIGIYSKLLCLRGLQAVGDLCDVSGQKRSSTIVVIFNIAIIGVCAFLSTNTTTNKNDK